VSSFGVSCLSRRTVCILSQSRVKLRSILNPIALKNRYHQIISTAVVDRERSSASVVERVTDRYKVAFQSIRPPNSIKRYP
jgi:hypothetical protein